MVRRFGRGLYLRRQLPADLGGVVLHVSPEAGGLKYWKLNIASADPELLSLVREFVQPGMRVWDVGANVGLFAFAAAGRAGRAGKVLALEPDIDCAQGLLRTQRHLQASADVAEITVLPAAISKPGGRIARFLIAKSARASNSLDGFGQSQMGGVQEVRSVITLTLDELLAETFAPQCIKIDVEGAEMDVLNGAERVLCEARPVVLVEVSDASRTQVVELFDRFDYDVFDGHSPVAERVALRQAPWSTVARPRA